MTVATALRPLSFLLLLAAPCACSYGEVEWGNEPVVGADVKIETCNGDTWTTQTDGSGRYVFDGYEDDADTIPEGPVLVRVDLPNYSYHRLEFFNHAYTPCPDGSGKLCAEADVDFGWRPLSGWEWSSWTQSLQQHNDVTYHTFHNEVCIWGQS